VRSGQFYEETIARPSWHLLGQGGKQWRAVYMLLMLEMLGTPRERFEREAAVLAQLTHSGSLIIDDIEDGSTGRRGADCVHIAFGTDIAINAGNTLYFLPLLTLNNHPYLSVSQREEIFALINSYFVRAHFGQAYDLYLSRTVSPATLTAWLRHALRAELLEMYANKTAAQVMVLSDTACIIAHADAPVRAACRNSARSIGIAFQILDDIRGLNPAPGSLKQPGEDIISGKLTYLNHCALNLLPARKRERLCEIIAGKLAARSRKVLCEAVDLVKSSGAIETCHLDATRMFERSKLGPAVEGRSAVAC
jgi:geranylgeranyl pyrophosphate synthase